MPQNKPLSFEQFTKRDPKDSVPKYNNLILYLMETDISQTFREQPSFQKFQTEHPDLERKLREAMKGMTPSIKMPELLKPLERDLYSFYLIMRGYGVLDNALIGQA